MVDRAWTPSVEKASRLLMREVGFQQIRREDLARFSVPTTLIWGKQDRIAPLRPAELASGRYGWFLQVINDAV